MQALIERAQAAPLPELVAGGAVPSAEVLASLIPSVTAATVSDTYPDPDLGALMSVSYLAFRRRRSLLLLDLQKQVQFAELPWVAAVAAHGESRRPDDTLQVVRLIGAMALDAFPGTILPNPLVRELNQLLSSGGLPAELTEEVATDIFVGTFSDKFLRAARAAAELLRGTLYARYYDLDPSQLDRLEPERRRLRLWRRRRPRSDTFAELCVHRARSTGGSWSVANNGTIIEQGQILTTHNLAALVHLGVQPSRPWLELAHAAYRRTARLIALSQQQQRPLPTIKDAACAWRQALFFRSMAGDSAVPEFLEQARTTLTTSDSTANTVQSLLLAGLEDIRNGQRFDHEGVSSRGRQLLGWTTSRHWLTESITEP